MPLNDNERQELERWREFGRCAFMVLFTAANERPDHKWLNDNGWMSSSALFSDLNNLLKLSHEAKSHADTLKGS